MLLAIVGAASSKGDGGLWRTVTSWDWTAITAVAALLLSIFGVVAPQVRRWWLGRMASVEMALETLDTQKIFGNVGGTHSRTDTEVRLVLRNFGQGVARDVKVVDPDTDRIHVGGGLPVPALHPGQVVSVPVSFTLNGPTAPWEFRACWVDDRHGTQEATRYLTMYRVM